MLWLLLEAGFALVVGLAIVWWTWPRTPPDDKNEPRD